MTLTAVPDVEPDLTEDEATLLTAQIREGVANLWDLIKEAHRRRVWLAKGFDTWEDWCVSELDCPPIAIDDRPAVMGALRDSGMSTRAIAAATGTSQSTAARATQVSQADSPITGTDGKTYPAKRAKPKSTKKVEDVTEDVTDRAALLIQATEQAIAAVVAFNALSPTTEERREFYRAISPPRSE